MGLAKAKEDNTFYLQVIMQKQKFTDYWVLGLGLKDANTLRVILAFVNLQYLVSFHPLDGVVRLSWRLTLTFGVISCETSSWIGQNAEQS